jgi:peptidoglycan-N-acetylglucosamine deacetylase
MAAGRTIQMLAGCVVAVATITFVGGASAQTQRSGPVPGQAIAPAAAPRACDPARVLGVSRVVEIDTTGGPRFGHQQYKERDLLAEGEVVLTFDDGPLRVHTQAVVDALEAQCTKATFFMVGSQALADPEMVRQIHRKGHTIGTHTQSHSDLRKLNPQQARQELELGFSSVSQALGQPIAPFFRFPFLSDSKAMKGYAETRGIGIFSIEIDALDYRNKEAPEAVHAQVMSQLAYQRKGILLFHDIQPSTARALPGLLAAIKARGFRIVHLKAATPYATLPEFDGLARRDSGARRVATANNPLANRGVTWPMQTPGQPAAGAPVQPPPPPQAAPAAVPSAPLPWANQPPPQRMIRPSRPPSDWRDSVFGR